MNQTNLWTNRCRNNQSRNNEQATSKKAWNGLKNMSGLAKLKISYYDPISEEEQTTLTNFINTFYTRSYSYTPPDDASVPDSASVSDTASVHNAASAPDVAPVPDSESSVNTTVPDAAVDGCSYLTCFLWSNWDNYGRSYKAVLQMQSRPAIRQRS